MDRSTFESADPVIDEIVAKLEELLDSDQFAFVRLLLARLSETVGPRYSVNLNVAVDVFDAERRNGLPLLTTGLSTSEGKSPHKRQDPAPRGTGDRPPGDHGAAAECSGPNGSYRN
jgi:hypothetical protein